MDDVEAGEWLSQAWQEALEAGITEPDPEVDDLTGAKLVSVRYAFLTQLLGKHARHSRDALCLQRGESEGAEVQGRWDPRSFCTSVIVPWVQESSNVLGTSGDPYVSNPLRRSRLDEGTAQLRDKDLWNALAALLAEVQDRDDPRYTEAILQRCLSSIVRLYRELQVSYPVPQRVSLDQTVAAATTLLESTSGGEASLVVVASLMRVIGRTTGLFDRVERQGINEPDTASGAPGDVLCFLSSDAAPVLAVEVKDRNLTLLDLNSTIQKAREARVSEVLFTARPPAISEREAIEKRIREEWGQGISVYQVDTLDLMNAVFPILGPDARVEFLTAIGTDLDERAAQPALRQNWVRILREIGTAS